MNLKIIVSAVLLLINCWANAATSAEERQALVALYEATNGEQWQNNSNWLIDDPCDNEWYGVSCVGEKVVFLNLSHNNSHGGSIPAEIGQLVHLKILSLTDNNLTGEIPPEIGQMTELTRLLLRDNKFSGAVPAEIGNLTSVYELNLSSNLFTGLPPEIGQMTGLEFLYLFYNKIKAIPPEIGSLTSLKILYISNNELISIIPPEVGSLVNLEELYLHENQLSGNIPAEMGNMSNLKELYLNDNQLTGSIPPEFGLLTELYRLDLGRNLLTGTIPAEMGKMNSLSTFYAYENQITGEIPVEFYDLSNLSTFNMYGNELTGIISPSIKHLVNLSDLSLSYNQLSGEIPIEFTELDRVIYAYLSNNQLSGEIPAEIGNMSRLKSLGLNNNNLEGNIPIGLKDLEIFESLNLNDNKLSGELPPELAESESIRSLRLANNQFSGSLPVEYGKFRLLDLANNEISGEIPNGFRYTRELYLANNDFSGEIPVELGSGGYLRILDLSNNQLFGKIPQSIGTLENLELLNLSENQLSGMLPNSLGQLSKMNTLYLSSNQLQGEVLESLLSLEYLTALDLSWNALYSTDNLLNESIDGLLCETCGSDWMNTQTRSPDGFNVTGASDGNVTVEWGLVNNDQAGGYQLWMADSPLGPFEMVYETDDLQQSTYTVEGLGVNETPYFQLKTFTSPHSENSNWVFADAVDSSGTRSSDIIYPLQNVHSGSWNNLVQNGHGISFEKSDTDSGLIYWYVFDDNGQPVWLVGSGVYDGNAVNAQMRILNGGVFPPDFDSEAVNSEYWGTVTFSMTGDSTGQFIWQPSRDSDFSQGKLNMTQFTRPVSHTQDGKDIDMTSGDIQAAYSGSWYNPEQSGHGLVVEFLPNNVGLIYWYIFDDLGNQVWLVGSGSHDGENLTVNMTQASGAMFPPAFDTNDVIYSDWGQVSLSFDSCTKGLFSWEPKAGSLGYSSGQMEVVHFSQPSGLSCESKDD